MASWRSTINTSRDNDGSSSAFESSRREHDANVQLQRQLREGLLRKSKSLGQPPSRAHQQHQQHSHSNSNAMSAANSHCNTIDVGESDVESDDDWVASDYQDSEVASSSAQSRDSMTLVSNDGGVIREDAPYIISSSSRWHQPFAMSSSSRDHDRGHGGSRSDSFQPPFLHRHPASHERRHKRAHTQQHQLFDGGVPDAPLDRRSAPDNADWIAQSHANLFTRKHTGLLVSLAFASMLTSCLKRGVLPLMQAEMAMASYQVDATKILLMLPWSCALLIGFVSDLFPLFGSHRKAYMMLGWVVAALALLVMVLLNHSFNVNGKLQQDSNMAESKRNAVVAGYITLLGAACFGEIASVIVAEIYVVALSQREVLKHRGFAVGTFLLVQFFFEGVGQIVTDTVVFQFTPAGKMQPFYSLDDVLTFLTCYALVPIPVLYYFFDDFLESTGGRIGECELLEDDDDDEVDAGDGYAHDLAVQGAEKARGGVAQSCARVTGRRIKRHWLQLWRTLEEKATWSVLCFLCIFIFFTEFTLKYPFTVLDKWARVTAKTTSTSKIFVEIMYFVAALAWLMAFRRRNWNDFVVGSYLGLFVFPSMAYYLTCAFSGMGPIELYMFMGSLHGFVRGVAIILEVAMTVEIARRGTEGALLGAVVSMASIIRLVSETYSNMIGWLFGTQFLAQDTGTTTKDEPMLVATALILCYTIRLLALVGVLFLPSQKIALLRLRFMGGRKTHRAWCTLAIFVVSMLTSSIVNSLVITPNTMCLPVFGGKGCSSK